jgi:hypothetical protein
METLGQKRCRFTKRLSQLIQYAETLGLYMALDGAKRSDEQAEINAMGFDGRAHLAVLLAQHGFKVLAELISNNAGDGIRNSLHELGLAADFNLYNKDGRLLPRLEDYRPLGEYWESLDPDCRWGGRFLAANGKPKPDAPHFSIENGGRK